MEQNVPYRWETSSLTLSHSIPQALYYAFCCGLCAVRAARRRLADGVENEARLARVTSTRTKAGSIRTPVQLFNANGAVIALAAKPT